MPCYDPPAPWHEDQKDDCSQAARLLCRLVGDQLREDVAIDPQCLTWFLRHRQIDYKIATTEYYGRPNESDAKSALEDMKRVYARLKKTSEAA